MAAVNNNAFPVHPETFQGTAASQPAGAKGLIHSDEDGNTVTIDFGGGSLKQVTLSKGEDISVVGADTITSTASVKIS